MVTTRSVRLAALMLCALTSGCTVRYAHNTFSEPLLHDARTSVGIEAGGYFWEGEIKGQRGDLAALGMYQKFDFATDAAAAMLQARTRWFPLEPSLFRPFLAGGLGVYKLSRTESDARCRGTSICVTSFSDQRGRATILSPHLAAGAELRPSETGAALVFAVTREFARYDLEWELTGWRFSAGVTYRPK